ncbi:hypothetical protein [Bartonella florencae]|uniref:hypothetical protein n=1 Tax=Bartonella florencae TaxID=928210 RepID=UPI0002E467A3|nr:hypothetical protein [Bartonella florencae]
MTGICLGGDKTVAGMKAGVWGKIYGSARGVACVGMWRWCGGPCGVCGGCGW